jgi:hypothetical protein
MLFIKKTYDLWRRLELRICSLLEKTSYKDFGMPPRGLIILESQVRMRGLFSLPLLAWSQSVVVSIPIEHFLEENGKRPFSHYVSSGFIPPRCWIPIQGFKSGDRLVGSLLTQKLVAGFMPLRV